MEAGVAHADDRLIIILACTRVSRCRKAEPFGKDPVRHAADEDAVFDDRRVDARRTLIVDMQRDGAMLSEYGMREIGQGDKFACDLFPHIRGSNRILCRDGIGFTGVTDCFVRKHTGKTRRKDALMLATFDFCLVFVCFGEILLQLLISVVCKCIEPLCVEKVGEIHVAGTVGFPDDVFAVIPNLIHIHPDTPEHDVGSSGVCSD